MHLKNLIPTTLILTLGLVAACGGSPETQPESVVAEPTADTPPAAEPTPESFPLAGGEATEIHPGNAGSPHVKVDWVVNGANISITYGRPFLRDRVVGEDVEPMGDQVWRLGADEATVLTTDSDLMLGSTHIPAGEYTLFAQQMGDDFHLIINSETGQWGLSRNPDHDVAHVPMEVTELSPPADQLTLRVDESQLGFEWGQMAASVPLVVH